MMKALLKKILIVVVLVGSGYPLQSMAGIGMSPAQINYDYLLPGSHAIQEITISREDSASAVKLKTIISESIAEFISFPEELEFTIPAGTQNYPIRITIEIPEGISLKTYQGNITFKVVESVIPSQAEGSSAATQLQLSLPVILTVQDKQVVEYAISDMIVEPIEIKQPLTVFYNVQNTGNVAIQPKDIAIRIADLEETQTIFNESYELPENTIAPFTYQLKSFSTPIEIPAGQYWAEVTISDKEQNIKTTRKLSLEVVPEQTINIELKAGNVQLNSTGVLAKKDIVATVPINNLSTHFVAVEVANDIYDTSGNKVKTITQSYALRPTEQTEINNQFNIDKAGQYTIKTTLTYLGKFVTLNDTNITVNTTKKNLPLFLESITNPTSTNKRWLIQSLVFAIVTLSLLAGGILWYIKQSQKKDKQIELKKKAISKHSK